MLRLRKLEVFGDLGTAEIKMDAEPGLVWLTCDDGARQNYNGRYTLDSASQCGSLARLTLQQINLAASPEVDLIKLKALLLGFLA